MNLDQALRLIGMLVDTISVQQQEIDRLQMEVQSLAQMIPATEIIKDDAGENH